MGFWKLAKNGLVFYFRTSLGVILAAALSTAVLTGALVIGDSVRYSLQRMVDVRLGSAHLALSAQGRFFRDELAVEIAGELGVDVAAVLQLRGLISNSDGSARVNSIQVLGVDDRFFKLGAAKSPFDPNNEGVVLNRPLAYKLGVKVGEDVVLRIGKPGLMPRDVPLTPDSDISVASRLPVVAIAGEDDFGGFNLAANQVAPLNAFVPRRLLQDRAEQQDKANMLLVAGRDDLTDAQANAALGAHWQLADAAMQVRSLDEQGVIEIRSSRVFIEDVLAEAAEQAGDGAYGVLTYFVNEVRLGDRAAPYSVAAALGKGSGIVPDDMADDEIVLNQWLADDIGAAVGDTVETSYFVVGPMRKLVERKSSFKVREVIATTAADRELMPDYPGLADVNNCRDWKPGIPIDLDKIHDEDEEYWDVHKGTPKAFTTLDAGQRMWGNRYGKLTMVRYPADGNSTAAIAETIRTAVEPASVGLFFQPVRQRGLKAGSEGTDFGQLFLGLSMFLIAAALVLMGLIFVFGVESRTEQVGMLLAVGLTPRQVRRLLLVEGGVLSLIGVAFGVFAAIGYTKAMIFALATMWSSAVAGSAIHFHAAASTLAIGGLATFLISIFAIWLTVRKQASRPARELLAGQLTWQFFKTRFIAKGRGGFLVALIAAIGAVGMLCTMGRGEGAAVAGVFFGAGGLLLIAGFGLAHGVLAAVMRASSKPMRTLAGLGLRNATRRRGRSLAVVILLAAGVFLVVAVGANRQDPMAGAGKRGSGTGGFEFFGESSIGILHDLNDVAGLEEVGFDETLAANTDIIQMRVRQGDDASCFNLNRAQRPRLLGVPTERLEALEAFSFAGTIEETGENSPWRLLRAEIGDDVIPGVADYATATWALGKKIGDDIEYTDERGRSFKVRIVATLKNSILQGNVIIDENALAERFPSEDGYRAFLIDANEAVAEQIASEMSVGLQDYGLTLTSTVDRLAAFSSVQNTYLTIFQMLGGLGLVLGSIGLGLVVLRNVLDRRGELAMLRAVGFEKAALKRMVFHEHWALMLAAIVIGVVAAVVAVIPALRAPGADVPCVSLALTVAAIAISGMIWIWAATSISLGGAMLDALRNE